MELDQPRRRFLQLIGGTAAAATVAGTATYCGVKAGDQPTGQAPTWRGGTADPAAWGPGSALGRTPSAGGTALGRHSPYLLSMTEGLPLSNQISWLDCKLEPDVTYRLQALVAGRSGTAKHAAQLCFDLTDGTARSRPATFSQQSGPYVALTTSPGVSRTDVLFTVPKPARAVGVATRPDHGYAAVRTLSLAKAADHEHDVDFFLSFDVEALPGRAPQNLIDTLVWGKFDGNEYGIPRICQVLGEHRLTGNFLVDFASCGQEGDRRLAEIVDFLRSKGHEVHIHLHSEHLARVWGISANDPLYLDKTSYDMGRRMLDYAVGKYVQHLGEMPRVFRAGGFRFNGDLLLAGGSLGLEAFSNVRDDAVGDPAVGGDAQSAREPYRWENGVLEIPVDYSPEPLATGFDKYLDRYRQTILRKSVERTYNLVMHSWSLTRRNEQGFHVGFEPEHERRLHQICDHIVEHGTARGYCAYLDARPAHRPVLRLGQIRVDQPERYPFTAPGDFVRCIICDATFSRSVVAADGCPSCGSAPRHRYLSHAIANYGNVFDRRSVLAYQALTHERHSYFAGSSNLRLLTDDELADGKLKIKSKKSSFDCFAGLNLLNQVKNDGDAVAEIARVLNKGGVFVSTVNHRTNGPTQQTPDGRIYGLADYLRLLSAKFKVSPVPALDGVTDTTSRVFLAYKKA